MFAYIIAQICSLNEVYLWLVIVFWQDYSPGDISSLKVYEGRGSPRISGHLRLHRVIR